MIESLKKEILLAFEAASIAQLYLLEQRVLDSEDEVLIQGFYANILELALDGLTNTLQSAKHLQMEDVESFALLRALYEYAIEHYSANAFDDSAALFEILAGLSNDERFTHAMKVHQKAALNKMPFDDFIEKVGDLDAVSRRMTFYIGEFKAHDLLNH